MDQFISYLPWMLFVASMITLYANILYTGMLKTENENLKDQLSDAQSIIYTSGKKIGELTNEVEDWKFKATCPTFDPPPTIEVNPFSVQKIRYRIPIDYRKRVPEEEQIRIAQGKLLKELIPYIHYETIKSDFETYLQLEIYVHEKKNSE